ncbi:acyl-CoA thioesterase [Embleya scabrispora]|uniref:acyl-CoA thioesterase n=1 Tax=Embleya scabrispora TaxID=159449 RepID=UPI00039C2C7F|nr:hotdog domain-containing protein [Embleya scabrispora]MYS82535.1 acyl-CoA thioesterase [Streptomyces sp. SID5474]
MTGIEGRMPADEVAAQIADFVLPPMLNHHGTLFAGMGLQLLVKAAVVAASRQAQGDVVMASCRDVAFIRPVRGGELVTVSAFVRAQGRTSLDVWAEAVAEDPTRGSRYTAIEGLFRLVRVDDVGRPTPLAAHAADGALAGTR